MSTHVVIGGAGQIGHAIASVLEERHEVYRVDPPAGLYEIPSDGVHVMHVAIRWSDTFEQDVQDYIERFDPSLVAVHSTVPVGTCDRHGWVHAPVRGRHPNLAQGVNTFPMHFGGQDAHIVASAFDGLVGDAILHDRAADTEAGKLWELAQLGIQARVMQEIMAYCVNHGLDFDAVYTQFAESYNAGYSVLEPQFVRPVLEWSPPPLGGHCVAQNSPMLGSEFVRDLLEPISPSHVDWN